jgi:serine O-acetyltransferase
MDGAAKARARAAWHTGPESRPASALAPNPMPLELHHTSWWRHIYLDYRRYRITGDSAARAQGFWASCIYRVSRAAVYGARPRFLRAPLRIVAILAQKLTEVLTGISIPAECEIGEGLYIGHFGGIILSRDVRIGHNCSLAQNVTLGTGGKGESRGAPTIGNRVFIGTHSVIVGRIQVGEDAMVCAGSVVTRDVAPRAVVVGNPARVVSFEGSFDHVVYDGVERDADRQMSRDAA